MKFIIFSFLKGTGTYLPTFKEQRICSVAALFPKKSEECPNYLRIVWMHLCNSSEKMRHILSLGQSTIAGGPEKTIDLYGKLSS